jgi:hypothetical protein
MTASANLKRAVRDRMAATGENYTRARNTILAERHARLRDEVRQEITDAYDLPELFAAWAAIKEERDA